MTPETCAELSTAAVSGLAAGFMLDGATYAAGMGLGYSGIDFYLAGRAGVLGRFDADEIAGHFGFFPPETIAAWTDQATGVLEPQAASVAYMDVAYAWADAHLGDDVDWARLAELAGQAIAAGPDAGAPMFAAWRAMAEPELSPKQLALHRFQVLRELRNELHVAAVAAAGLTPVQALMVKTPAMAPMFGYPADTPEATDEDRAAHAIAEAATNAAIAPVFATAFTDDEREEFVTLAKAALRSVH